MQSLLMVSILLFANTSFASTSTSSKCPGETGYYFINYKHRNPTQGGFVSNKADVQDTDDLMFIGPEAAVCGSSRVSGRARIFGEAVITNATIKDEAEISENATIGRGAVIFGNAKIAGNARIFGSVEVSGNAVITESAFLYNDDSEKLVTVLGKARIAGSAVITDDATIEGAAKISGKARLSGDVQVAGTAVIKGFTERSTGKILSGIHSDPDYVGIALAKRKEEARIAEEKRLLALKIAEEKRIRLAKLEQERKEAIEKCLERMRLDEADKLAIEAAKIAKKLRDQKEYDQNEKMEMEMAQMRENLIKWGNHEDFLDPREGGVREPKEWPSPKFTLSFSGNNCLMELKWAEGPDAGKVLTFDFSQNFNIVNDEVASGKNPLKKYATLTLKPRESWKPIPLYTAEVVQWSASTSISYKNMSAYSPDVSNQTIRNYISYCKKRK